MGRAAVVQMTSKANVKENLHEIERLFIKAHEDQVELLVLPENFAFMGINEADKFKIAETPDHGEIQATISRLAKHFKLWVIAGTIPLRGVGNRLRSSCLVFDDKGTCAARYDKIHLFDVRVSEKEAHQESLTTERGENAVVVDTPVGRVGLSVCYDLRFPELYRQLVMKGAEIFTIASAFTAVTGLAHWEILLRARAIENLCYVLAPNQEGRHDNGRQSYGHSMIIEPWGSVLGEMKKGSGLLVQDIDLQRLQILRRDFPCNEHHILCGV